MLATLFPAEAPLKADWTAEIDGYRYVVRTEGKRTWYQVRRGDEVLRLPVAWTFGSGRTGQTFVLEHNGRMLESRVSYYPRHRGLDLTMGAANARPENLEEAAGRLMSASDVNECFGCHSTSTSSAKGGLPGTLEAGVQCRRCHGDVGKHPVAKMASLKKADTDTINELCGQCHRTWEHVKLARLTGVATVRFQPYRISLSKCYDLVDRRISCTGCHDPHSPGTTVQKVVDATCTSCHTGEAKKACPVGKADCASCHMPKYDLPGAHAAFTDHRIRVVGKGEGFVE